MKKVIICAVLAVAMICCGTALYAQMAEGTGPGGQGPHRMSSEQRLQRLTQMLNLTDDQQRKIKPIMDNESQQMQSLRQDTSMSQQDKFAKMRDIRQNTLTQIKPILTADQQKKFDEQMANRHAPPSASGAGEQATPPPPPPQ